VQADIGAEHGADDVLGAGIGLVPAEPLVERRFAVGEFLEGLDDQVEVAGVQAFQLEHRASL